MNFYYNSQNPNQSTPNYKIFRREKKKKKRGKKKDATTRSFLEIKEISTKYYLKLILKSPSSNSQESIAVSATERNNC